MEDDISQWNCKCGCVSKYSHRSRWAFISKYKHNSLTKYKNIQEENQSNNSLINKLLLKRTNSNTESIRFVPVKKVKYDSATGKIIIEEIINEEIIINKKIQQIDKSNQEQNKDSELNLIIGVKENNVILESTQLVCNKNVELNEQTNLSYDLNKQNKQNIKEKKNNKNKQNNKHKDKQNKLIIENKLIDLKDLISKFN